MELTIRLNQLIERHIITDCSPGGLAIEIRLKLNNFNTYLRNKSSCNNTSLQKTNYGRHSFDKNKDQNYNCFSYMVFDF